MGARAVSLPRDVTPFQYYKTLLRVLDTGSDLPEGWDVELRWQNPDTVSGRTREMQYDDFAEAVSQSNAGFRSVVRRMLAGYVMRYRYAPPAPPPPPPPPPKRKRRRVVKPKSKLRRKPVERVKPKPRPKLKRRTKRVYKRDKRGRFVKAKKRR